MSDAEITSLRQRVEALEAALQRIADWADAYPPSVFPEMTEEYSRNAQRVLTENGMTIDRISASAMRHVVQGVGKIAAAALAPTGADR